MTEADRTLVDRFLDMMAAESGRGAQHTAAYRSDLEAASLTLGELSARQCRSALKKLGEAWRDLAPSTVARRAATLRRFFGFLLDEGLRSDDPSAALPRPVHQRPLPKILDVA